MDSTSPATKLVHLRLDDGRIVPIRLPLAVLKDLTLLPLYLEIHSILDDGTNGVTASSSWDIGVTASSSGNTLLRPSPSTRHNSRKIALRTQRREILKQQLENHKLQQSLIAMEIRIHQDLIARLEEKCANLDMLGLYETSNRLMQALNDRIFDVEHIIQRTGLATTLTQEEKSKLKKKKLQYITDLLSANSPDTNYGETTRSLIKKALDCLTIPEQNMCRHLRDTLTDLRLNRNESQHPMPSIKEAKLFVSRIHDIDVSQTALLLLNNPDCLQRLPRRDESAQTSQPLFSSEGTLHWESTKASLDVTRLELEAARGRLQAGLAEQEALEAEMQSISEAQDESEEREKRALSDRSDSPNERPVRRSRMQDT